MSTKDVFSHVNSYRVYRTNWRTSLYHTVRVKWWSAQSLNEETSASGPGFESQSRPFVFPFYYMWLCVLPFTILHFTVNLVNQQLKSSSCSLLEPESTTIHGCNNNQNNIWFNDSYFKERNYEINCFNHIFKTVIRFS